MSNSLNIDIEDKNIVQTGKVDIFHGEKLDDPIDYHVVELTKEDIQLMLIFQQVIVDHLKDDEQSYFLEKSKGFLTEHFNKGSKAIGFVCNGAIVGQALIVNPTQEHPKTGMTDMEEVGAPESISVIQGVGVHPLARGMNIGDKLIKAWMDVSLNDNRHNVIAETEQNNVYSWRLFVNNGLAIVSESVDPSDGAKLYNHHKVLNP